MSGLDLGALGADLDARLASADRDLHERYPGDATGRQPVHTVYVPADRYHADLAPAWGSQALAALADHGGPGRDLAGLLDLPAGLSGADAEAVQERVVRKLGREPVEDLRIDFEDGYGDLGDESEDRDAEAAARALAASVEAGTAPPGAGIRFKCLERATRGRALRTLDRFVGTLLAAGGWPAGFVVTLPKVTSVDQVEAMVVVCERLEQAHGLAAHALRFEIQVETSQAVLGPDGTALVARMVHASGGRCSGLHYGTYDYSAACGIAAGYQSMEHPAADHAKAVMQVASAGTGVRLSDGSTNVLPVGDGESVRSAWRLHARLVRRSLERGFYQGWDLHPAQLVSRYGAVYAFYREGLRPAAGRLGDYLGQHRAGVLDEPATARALADFLVRGIDCGAVDLDEVTALSGADGHRLAVLARREPAG